MSRLVEKYRKMSIPVKAGLWFTICNILQRGISIITVPIFTRILTTNQYGTYSLYISWFNIFSVFTSMNLYYGVFNKAMVKYKGDRDKYISSMQGLTITLCGIYFLVYILFRKQLNEFIGLSTLIIFLMFIEMLVTPALQFWSGRQRFEYRYRILVRVSLIKTIFNPLLGVIAVMLSSYKTEARIFATIIAEVAICGILMIQQFYKGKSFFVKKYWTYAIRFNVPLIPHYLSSILLNQGDKIVINKIDSPSAVAFYSVAYNVGMLTQLVTNAITQAVTPWLYSCLNQKKYLDINKRLRPLMVLVASLCILLMLFAPEIVWIFASEEYVNAVYAIPPIAASVFFIYMYNIYSNFEFYFEKRMFITFASIFSALANLWLNYIFIPLFGYVAAGYTTLFCYMIYAIAHYLFSFYICKKEILEETVFKFKDIFLASILIVLFMIFINFLYANIIVRYSLVALVVLVLIVKRNKIILLFKFPKGD